MREIVLFIARNNPVRARTFRNELFLKAQSISDHPWMGRVVPERNDEGLREIVRGAYRIVYRVTVETERVTILRFWHAARGNPQIVED